MDEVVTLIKRDNKTATDADGNPKPTEIRREVFARRVSIGQKEFFEAMQQKLNPRFSLILFRYDYDGEEIVEVDGKQYNIYRTYMRTEERMNKSFTPSEQIELYCVERVNG